MGGSRASTNCSPPLDWGIGGSGNAPVHFLSPYWVWLPISKDVRAQKEQEDIDWNFHPIQGIDDNDRVSLDTPKEGTTVRDLKSRGGGNCGVNYSTLHLRDTEDPAKMWLPQKVRHCCEMVGITVDKNKGGWESLMAFAHN
ncbi:hypothetical protein AAC387_Pa06g1098 [Persea americana]